MDMHGLMLSIEYLPSFFRTVQNVGPVGPEGLPHPGWTTMLFMHLLMRLYVITSCHPTYCFLPVKLLESQVGESWPVVHKNDIDIYIYIDNICVELRNLARANEWNIQLNKPISKRKAMLHYSCYLVMSAYALSLNTRTPETNMMYILHVHTFANWTWRYWCRQNMEDNFSSKLDMIGTTSKMH